ncbi:hypothetical protein HPB50_018607 [Hyalomma asiaticum]|uniref:Uncharacterized protein n=1 Tax=Hyalomma asiaticum TaxID=266040 RepID=A0ACB7SIF8_HYAAI|nr:hypothetical protein HPB50_018607 [Hyalomma asiaticum]
MHNNQQAPQSTLEPQPDYEALFSARLMQLEHNIMAKVQTMIERAIETCIRTVMERLTLNGALSFRGVATTSTRFRRERDLGTPNIGICGHCNTRADLAHLIWDCPLYSGTRQRVIAAIPPEWRPTSFQAWAQPGRITGAAANELWRSLLEYLDDPKAPAVGTRLRLGRDSQNVNSRDAH